MTILVTGGVGFIGFHVCQALLGRGEQVVCIDNCNQYYDPALKSQRLGELEGRDGFQFFPVDISDGDTLRNVVEGKGIDRIIHLAAQAGVRYSIENPGAYVSSNLVGHCNVLEVARDLEVSNMVYASSSSVYGGNVETPFSEGDVTDNPVSFYGATKKSNELLSNSYAHLYGLSLTGLRFFTVYGPWGRPDMAYWIFSEKLKRNEPIRVFNNGDMSRDFTFIDDIVDGVLAALDRPASKLGLAVPHRVYNLGNDHPEKLMDLVAGIEASFGKTLEKVFETMQMGDVQHTWANIDRARRELGFSPKVSLSDGLARFARWFEKRAV